MSDNRKKELEQELSELQGLLYIEKTSKNNFCGATYAQLLYEIEKIEKQLEEMEKDNDSNI